LVPEDYDKCCLHTLPILWPLGTTNARRFVLYLGYYVAKTY